MNLSKSLSDFYDDSWKNVVVSGELGRLTDVTNHAKKDIDERIEGFLSERKIALEKNERTFTYRDRTYKITKNVKDNYINYQKTKGFEQRKGIYAYRLAEPNSWIFKTLLEKKKKNLFQKCNRLVMVGCGIYPYSMYDIHKKYKHIKQLGIEIDEKRASVARSLVKNCPAKDSIAILTMDGNNFDYSKLNDDDLIFISCDVNSENIVKKIVETSKAHFFICAPYNKAWLKEVIYNSKIVLNDEGNITSISDT